MKNNNAENPVKPMPLWLSLLYFGIPTIVLYLATNVGIPFLDRQNGLPSVVNWFISGGILVFIPLFLLPVLLFVRESNSFTWNSFKIRFRLKPMARQDWYWALGGLAVISAAMGLIFATGIDASTPFMHFDGLEPGQGWIMMAWPFFFFFNIVGEELMWRGYILPRQQLVHGDWTWLVQGCLWTLFHYCFGWRLIITLLPILFVLPYVVHKRQNTWIGIFIHGAINGLGFISLALGFVK